MLEIKVNLHNKITIKDSDETTGIETVWNFSVLQQYIENNDVPKNVIPHLVKWAMYEVKSVTFINFSKEEYDRLEKDLLRAVYRLYYTTEMRDFKIELDEGYFKIYEGESLINHFTALRFERDLKLEENKKRKGTDYIPTKKDVAISCLNYITEGKTLTAAEMNKLSDDMVKCYEVWRAEEDKREAMIEELKKKKK